MEEEGLTQRRRENDADEIERRARYTVESRYGRYVRGGRGGGEGLFFSSSPYLNHGYGFTRRNDEAIGRRRRLRCPLREL